LHNRWISKPARLQYTFDEKELYKSYCMFAKNIQTKIASYPKNENKELNKEGINKLKQLLINQKLIAFDAKEKNLLHEYCMIYNTYRIAKRFGLFEECYKYIYEISKNEGEYEQNN